MASNRGTWTPETVLTNDGNLVLDGEYEVLTGLVASVHFLRSDPAVFLLQGLGVGDCQGVVHGTDLHDNLHLAGVVEHCEGVEIGGELAIDALVGFLKRADIFQALYGNGLTGILFLVEIDRLHYAGDDAPRQKDAQGDKNDVAENFECFVHYAVFYFSKTPTKL